MSLVSLALDPEAGPQCHSAFEDPAARLGGLEASDNSFEDHPWRQQPVKPDARRLRLTVQALFERCARNARGVFIGHVAAVRLMARSISPVHH